MADFETPTPDFPLEKSYGYSTLTTKFENGVEQRRPTRSSSITVWHLTFRNRPQSDRDFVFGLYEACKGAFSSFTWLNPEDGQTYTVRFKDDSVKSSYKMFGLWDFEFDLVMVI